MDEEIREKRIRRRHRPRKARLTHDSLDRVSDPNDFLEPELDGRRSPTPSSAFEEEGTEDEVRSLDE